MTARTWLNVGKNALSWRNLRVMIGKVWLRLFDPVSARQRAAARDWCATHAESAEEYARSLNEELWCEAVAFAQELRTKSLDRLGRVAVDLGGGGHYPLLYFLTRYLKPAAVLETGVAAGFSSAALLAALERNQRGELFSSDFPYFRLDDPEQYIGIMVDDSLRHRWHLYTEGDRHNLPKILGEIGQDVSLVHYDSDKSLTGKRYFVQSVAPRLASQNRAYWIFDDIDDDQFFAEFVKESGCDYHVFAFEGKYLGVAEIRR